MCGYYIMSYCGLELKNRGLLKDRYYIRICRDERETRVGKTEIGPIYFKPDERIETMATNNLNETVRHLPSDLEKQVIDFYNEEKKKREGKNEKEEDVSQTWKDTAAAAGGKRSKRAKKTKKVKRSKKAKKSIKNKKR